MTKTHGWKALLTRHDRLAKQGAAITYERVVLLVMVYEDPSYVEYTHKSGTGILTALDSRLEGTFISFMELLQILKLFPKKSQWINGNLLAMRTKMLDTLRARTHQQKKVTKLKKGKLVHVRKTATLAEVRDIEVKLKDSTSEVKHLREQLAEKERVIVEKERTIKTLEAALDSAHVTIGNLNEALSLSRIKRGTKSVAPVR